MPNIGARAVALPRPPLGFAAIGQDSLQMPRDRRSTRTSAAWSAVAVTTTLLAVALVSAPKQSAATSDGNLVSTAMQLNPGPISSSNSAH